MHFVCWVCKLHHRGPNHLHIQCTYSTNACTRFCIATKNMDSFRLPVNKTRVIIRMAALMAAMSPERKYAGWGEGDTWGRCAIWRAALSLNWCEATENEDHDARQRRGWVSVRREEWRARQENWFVWGMGGEEGVTGWGKGEGKVKMTVLE